MRKREEKTYKIVNIIFPWVVKLQIICPYFLIYYIFHIFFFSKCALYL